MSDAWNAHGSQSPDWQKKRLDFEAWSLTREEFRVSQLPSVAAIQRSIVKILES
ncbi:MAG: hypothetical protein WAO08_26670 [Hyphomicrobiaceae bacterium]